MHRTRFPVLRQLVVAAAAVAAVACADKAGPTDADIFGNKHSDGEYVISGTVLRYSLVGDTLGAIAPLSGARVALHFVGPFPTDSTPGDSTPGDSIPGDGQPSDSSLADTTWCVDFDCGPGTLRGAIDADTSGTARPLAVTASGADGSFRLPDVGNGLYRLDVTAPGETLVSASRFVGVNGADVSAVRIALPPSP